MANPEHLKMLAQGVEAWNTWRHNNPHEWIDLRDIRISGSHPTLLALQRPSPAIIVFDPPTATCLNTDHLRGMNLDHAHMSNTVFAAVDMSGASLRGADLRNATLEFAFLNEVSLRQAQMWNAKLLDVQMTDTDLRDALLAGASFYESDLNGCDLTGANLAYSSFVEVDLRNARLSGSCVYGTSAWRLRLDGAEQSDLVITKSGERVITVDNLEIAQFIHILLSNERIRNVIDTITSKVVLILAGSRMTASGF